MNQQFVQFILDNTNAKAITKQSLIQSLWSGYGQLLRVYLDGANMPSVIVKWVKIPAASKHPRGWNQPLGQRRKMRSYQVEHHWYQHYAHRCNKECRVPKCIALTSKDNELLFVMEDLHPAGFPLQLSWVNEGQIKACIRWLAHFHAQFMLQKPEGLWPVGTYWHLETRPDELEALQDYQLKNAAALIDQQLNSCQFMTFVHGDAKLANFCFSDQSDMVAAVDFQYVGGGCGMKDLVYFLGSCMDEQNLEQQEQALLDYYFSILKAAVPSKTLDVDALEKEWRSMYVVAYADFHRFIKGWSPGHWKINSYSERLTRAVIEQLQA